GVGLPAGGGVSQGGAGPDAAHARDRAVPRSAERARPGREPRWRGASPERAHRSLQRRCHEGACRLQRGGGGGCSPWRAAAVQGDGGVRQEGDEALPVGKMMSGASPRPGEAGYSLVALLAGITIMLVLMAAGSSTWKYIMKNDREQELIFRGGQIAD